MMRAKAAERRARNRWLMEGWKAAHLPICYVALAQHLVSLSPCRHENQQAACNSLNYSRVVSGRFERICWMVLPLGVMIVVLSIQQWALFRFWCSMPLNVVSDCHADVPGIRQFRCTPTPESMKTRAPHDYFVNVSTSVMFSMSWR
jgi:hypothetical protein